MKLPHCSHHVRSFAWIARGLAPGNHSVDVSFATVAGNAGSANRPLTISFYKCWRFYHHFRTDADSLLRQPQIGVQTEVLAQDGSDIAASLQTILEIGDDALLRETISTAFRGASLVIEAADTLFSLSLHTPGLLRPLQARELSDGQLRFLCLCAALLSPRPPSLLALNEPETSLHPDLIDSLGQLMVRAAEHTQLWITTHSRALAESIERHSGIRRVCLHMLEGETRISSSSN